MPVTIQATGILKQHIAPDLKLDNVRTAGEAVARLDLPEMGELIMLVNGRPAYWDTALADGDVLHLVPGISGGCRLASRQEPPAYP
jgi:molybdopterin converting factor small subunit